jgi:hypothetical protein
MIKTVFFITSPFVTVIFVNSTSRPEGSQHHFGTASVLFFQYWYWKKGKQEEEKGSGAMPCALNLETRDRKPKSSGLPPLFSVNLDV